MVSYDTTNFDNIERRKTMKKLFCVLLILSIAATAFSDDPLFTVKGTAPKTGNPTFDSALETIFADTGVFTTTMQTKLNEFADEFGLTSLPSNIIAAFGNSSVYASHGATQRNYGGYKSFAVTIGSSVGFQLPVSPSEILDLVNGGGDLLGALGPLDELTLGLNPQVINAQLGINASFLVKDLYLGLRVGYTPEKLGNTVGEMLGSALPDGLGFSFSSFLIGGLANIQLIPASSGLIGWRGVNLGSGFIFSTTKFGISMPIGSFETEFDLTGTNDGTIKIDPKVVFNMEMNTYTIPLELMTGINLLFVNIPIGIGADFAFGTSKMGIGIAGDISIEDSNGYINQTEPGSLSVTANGDMNPKFTNLKLMTGIGVKLGPLVLVDIPITWYFIDNGFHIGVTLGLVF